MAYPLTVEYRDGVCVRGSTRGDELCGWGLQRKYPNNSHCSAETKDSVPYLEVRGKVYMSDQSFELLCARQENNEEKPFKNPRNAAAGSLRQKNSAITATRLLDIFVFNIQQVEGVTITHHGEALECCGDNGLWSHRFTGNAKPWSKWWRKSNELGKSGVPWIFPLMELWSRWIPLTNENILGVLLSFPKWAEASESTGRGRTNEKFSISRLM